MKSGTSTVFYDNLGVPGDMAIPSAYTKQIGGEVTPDALAAARLSPKNATGGTNLYSQNFSWGTSVLGLPGRSGLDLNLGIGYNSLIWMKSGSAMYFDPDTSNAGAGFHFGFPTIEPVYYDGTKSKFAYMMVTPSGSRVEFRQSSVSATYESADSSYSQIVTNASAWDDPVEGLTLTVKTTDGTQMTYEWKMGAYRCTKIMDRNGNYISMTYTDRFLTTVTDTLGRVVTVNYNGDGLPSTITQTWKDTNGSGSNATHTWATLTYTTQTTSISFDSSLTVVGAPNGSSIKVLDKITYPDSSFTKFEYNGYLQVKKVNNVAADSTSHILNYTSINISSPSSGQTDCPRFTETRNWVENFNVVSGTAQETVVTNSVNTGASYSLPGSITGSATRIDVALTGHPDNLITKTYVGASGYKEGLTLATEDCISTGCTGTDRKRWTWNDYTQDNTSVSYITNPRLTESRVGDGTNTKKSTIDYHYDSGTGIYLPEYTKVYDTDLSTVLKQNYTQYSWSSTYTSRRIIGLPTEVRSSGRESTGLNLMSKVTYAYDEGNMTGTDPVQNVSPTQHDNSNYSSSFVTGRGLPTTTTRWDANYSTTSGYAVSSTVKYNTAGSAVSQTDPLSHTVKISYSDSYNSSPGVSTYAYPTTLTDPNSQSSTVIYRYDIGANVQATSPAPSGQTYGKTSKRTFDDKGRIEKESIFVNTTEKFWSRHVYPTNGVQSQTYTTVIDTPSSTTGPDTADEVYSETWFDGAGRVRQERSEHPGSSGGWSSTLTSYDILGRVFAQSVPTETNNSFAAAGDDYTRGFIYSYSYYDWKGRPVRTIPSDSTGSDGKDTLISYDGCGCAGGQITTVKGPISTAVDASGSTQTTKRRMQKSYEDILGRTVKSELFNLDDGSAYSRDETTFNGRDQATSIVETDVANSITQTATMSYDGHGRLSTSHKPEQRDGSTLKYTTYSYNGDDRISTATDGRGVVTNFTYNNRGLITGKAWNVGSTGVTDPTDVTFTYDNVGNRTQMTDELGTVNYGYDELSQLTSESRAYSDTGTGFTSNTVAQSYTYTLGGQLKSYATPFSSNLTINYAFDKIGRLSSVSGSSGTTYANNPHYRAWGALSHLEYGNGTEMNAGSFNNKLQATTFNVKKSSTYIINKSYAFNNDGSVSSETDGLDARFDRSYSYDFGSRMTKALTGAEARGSTDSSYNLPYHNTYSYDAFSHRTGIVANNFTQTPANISISYSNNKINSGTYDYDGNQLSNPTDAKTFAYDGAGNMSHTYIFLSSGGNYQQQTEDVTYDGDGKPGKVVTAAWQNTDTPIPDTTYNVRSAALGGQIIYEHGTVSVLAGGTRLWSGGYWNHQDPNGHTVRSTFSDGNVQGDGSLPDAYWDKKELDPDGKQSGFSNPTYYPLDDNDLFAPMSNFGEMIHGQYTTFGVDGLSVPFDYFVSQLHSLGHSSDIDSGTNLHLLGQLGVFAWHPADNPGGDRDTNDTLSVNSEGGGLRYAFAGWGFRSPQVRDGSACDSRLESIFGDDKSVVATEIDPAGILAPGSAARSRIGLPGEDVTKGIMHLYAAATGGPRSEGKGFIGNLFVPKGYDRLIGKADPVDGDPWDRNSNIQVHYPKNALSSFGYRGELTISMVHSGPIPKKDRVPVPIKNSKIVNSMGSQLVGTIGADGSDYDGGGHGGLSIMLNDDPKLGVHEWPNTPRTYVHSHFIFYAGRVGGSRIDPRRVFCSDLGFK